jgi:hypothetical protein
MILLSLPAAIKRHMVTSFKTPWDALLSSLLMMMISLLTTV